MKITITEHQLEDLNKYASAMRYALSTFSESLEAKEDDRLEKLYFNLTVSLEKLEEFIKELEQQLTTTT